MSVSNKKLILSFKSFESQFRSSQINTDPILIDCALIWCQIAIDMFSHFSLPVDISDVARNFCNINFEELIPLLKRCDDSLLSYLTVPEVDCKDRFKRDLLELGTIVPVLEPIIVKLVESVRDRCFTNIRLGRTLFVFMARLNVVTMEELRGNLEDFIIRNDNVVMNYSDYGLSKIITEWFSDFSLNSPGCFGPGAVARAAVFGRPSSIEDKYLCCHWDPNIVKLRNTCPQLFHPFGEDVDFVTPSTVRSVPKSFHKPRIIAMESCGCSYVQHGISRDIEIYLRNHVYLRRRIDLCDQSRNQRLALRGSKSGKLATIDLSNASDFVSLELVRKSFAFTKLLKPLISARSVTADINGILKPINMFGTMGNSLTFPIMSIILSAICEKAIRDSGSDPYTSCYSVYGDDIVIEVVYLPRVVYLLELYGFVVNKLKSYSTSADFTFRESCGGEYLNGRNVTPVRISRKFLGFLNSDGPQQRMRLVSLANDLLSCSLRARSYVLTKLSLRNLNVDDIDSLDSSALKVFGLTYCNNIRTTRSQVLSQRYQRGCILVKSTRNRQSNGFNEEIRYFESLSRMYYVRDILQDCSSELGEQRIGELAPIENSYKFKFI